MLLEIEECDLEAKLRDLREQIAMVKLKVCAEMMGHMWVIHSQIRVIALYS